MAFLLKKLEQLLKELRENSMLRKAFLSMACVAVFVTTYMLILPALTMETELVCGKEEHTHTDSCYKVEKVLICGKEGGEEHTHTDQCYEEKKVLVCTKEEHKHVKSCYKTVKDTDTSDSNADIETKSDWEKTFADVKLTGNWNKDIVAIAKTQKGYKQSTKNYKVVDDQKMGYSRYGEWDGSAYEDWNAAFVSFCLHYADVDEKLFPQNNDCQKWIKELKKMNTDDTKVYVDKKDYTPETGDIIFLDTDKDGEEADQAGIVIKVDKDKKEFTTMEGRADDGVCEQTYQFDDDQIMGYGVLPDNPKLEEATEATTEEATEATTEEATTEAATAEDIEETEDSTETEEGVDEVTNITMDDTHVKTYSGKDYSVTVTYSSDAEIPDDAQLIATEYKKSSYIYKQRYQEAVSLYGWDIDENYKSDFRLFNIGFYKDGEEIEPSAEVQVNITYLKVDTMDEPSYQVTHYGSGQAEEMDVKSSTDDGESVINFATDEFSDYSILTFGAASSSSTSATASSSEANLLAYFQFNQNRYGAGTLTDSQGNAKATSNDGAGWRRSAQWGYTSSHTECSYKMLRDWTTTDGYQNYLTVEANDGSALLAGNNTVSFDFWMKAENKSGTYNTGDTAPNWVFYAGNKSASNETYIGCYTDSSATSITVERFLNDRSASGSSLTVTPTETIADKMVHVRVDYTSTATYITVWNSNGTQIASDSVDCSNDLASILTESSVLQFGKANWGNGEYFNGFLDDIKIYAKNAVVSSGHPLAATTQNKNVTGVFLYNIDTASDNEGNALADVTYSVYDSDGNFVRSYSTSNEYALNLTGLDPGTYTIKQTGVPDDYYVVEQTTTFTVPDSTDGMTFVGYFFDYKDGEGYAPDKTAEVSNYADRVYDVTLSALSGKKEASIDARGLDFVVDQSNSMLFPAKLTDTGESFNFYKNGSTNSSQLDTILGTNCDTLYYFVADSSGTATVYAIWRSSDGKWYYQDASYYAQAQAGTSGYSYADVATGTSGYKIDSGSLTGAVKTDFNNNSSATFMTYHIYTGSTNNRLTYLKSAVKRLIYQLAAMDYNEEITVTTFDANIESCKTKQIGSDATGMNNAKELITFVDGINTSGGTAQNLGLWHVYNGSSGNGTNNSGCSGNHVDKGDIVVLITDGALNTTKYVQKSNIATDLQTAAKKIRDKGATLITIGLSVDDVLLAQELLTDCDTYTNNVQGIASPDCSYIDKDADKLGEVLANSILGKLMTIGPLPDTATIKDYISDSFYPVDSSGTTLSDGQWLDLQGNPVSSGSSNAAGQIHYDEDSATWYVIWKNQTLMTGNASNKWKGHIYLKAKEDFIGGNTIKTNKSAEIDLLDDSGNTTSKLDLDTPTVNVRLLDMNKVNSEETVFLGDTITELQQKIKNLESQVYFSKIKSGTGDELNAVDSATGLESDKFYLNYAMAGTDLTQTQWQTLFDGGTVTIPYTYDDDSSNGPVGEFVITLTKVSKDGETASLNDHKATLTGEEVETYTLKVEFKAYRITDTTGTGAAYSESTARSEDVHNGTNGPGKEVGSAGTTALTNGYGTVTSTNVHTVNVVDGKVTVKKIINSNLLNTTKPQTFVFNLMKQTGTDSSGNPVFEVVNDSSGNSVTLKATVKAGELESDITASESTLENLARGTYKLQEVTKDSDDYAVSKMEIIDSTNCKTTVVSDKEVTFTIGTDTSGNDVIETVNNSDSYHSVYTDLKADPDLSEGTKNVSYATVQVTNTNAKEVKIPVEKKWSDSISSDEYNNKTIYVALYQNGSPVLETIDNKTYVKVLKLNATNSWKGTFTIQLSSKTANVSTEGYSIMELSDVKTTVTDGYSAGVLVSDANGSSTTREYIYYKEATNDGIVECGDKDYRVSVADSTSGGVYTITATNGPTYELPESGGIGTTIYTMGGMMLLGIGLLYGFYLRRLRERGSE